MKQFLSTGEIAKLEKIAPITVQRWTRQGVFPNARKVGKGYRIPIKDYYDWRESTKVTKIKK